MHHYFIAQKHNESDYFLFQEQFNGVNFQFHSCSDVFSKNSIDYGSKVLIQSIIQNKDLFEGSILDVGCGYGTISIVLDKFLPNATFTLIDVNKTAVELSKQNVVSNKSKNIDKIFDSDLYSEVHTKFQHIISNPPIKTGKAVLIRLIEEGYTILDDGGTMTLVIKKNYGADSAKKKMETIFNNCTILKRDKGYYILHSKK